MAMSPIGEAVLIAREGRRLKAYRDSKGVWTIGVGITSASGLVTVRPGMVLTTAECDLLARRAFAQYAAHVDKALHGTVVAQHEYDALVSVCFNIGPGAFARSSFLRLIRAGDHKAAAEAILMWRKPAEIIPRRQGEYDQFRTPYAVRMPAARRGERAIRASLPTGSTGTGAAVVPPVVLPGKRAAADLVLPDWWMAIGRFLDTLFAPAKPKF